MSRNKRFRKTFAPSEPTAAMLREFGAPSNLSGLNAIDIGSAVFEAEQRLRERRIRRIVIPIYHLGKLNCDLAEIRRLVHELLIFTLVEDIEVIFKPTKIRPSRADVPGKEHAVQAVCLFSGGTDSYAGALLASEFFTDLKGVFCAHADQSRIIHIVSILQKKILEKRHVEIIKVPAPAIEARGYAQLRGFLYLLAAAAVAQKFSSQRVVVTECGPTMYQPRFSPLDSITMTTHPFVVAKAAQIGSLLLNRELRIMTPFEDLTKAEVIAISPEKDGLRYTHSCISSRFGTHDGTCYGCVIRRLATTAVGVKDVTYSRNPISDSNAHAGNLYSLLGFCHDILTDFRRMKEYERGIIDVYGKRDLFRRFALDNFAAIHRLLSDNKRVVRPVRDLYNSVSREIGAAIFDHRLRELARTTVPDHSKWAGEVRKPPTRPKVMSDARFEATR
jgi:7-cyano-7-deazaguanine synthase in queuosine biosynthesis